MTSTESLRASALPVAVDVPLFEVRPYVFATLVTATCGHPVSVLVNGIDYRTRTEFPGEAYPSYRATTRLSMRAAETRPCFDCDPEQQRQWEKLLADTDRWGSE